MADVLGDVMGALITKLAANAGLTSMGVTANGWWENTAPAGTSAPLGIIRFLSGGDSNSSPRRDQRLLVLVGVAGRTQAEARQGAGYVDDALHGTELSITGWSNYRCRANHEFAQDDHFEGKQIYLRGKMFGIWLDKN